MQVRSHGSVGEVELLADLPVRQPLGSHPRDLKLLGGQLIARLGCPRTARLARSAQFLSGPVAPGDRSERVEAVACRAQRGARLGDTPLAAKPGAKREQQPPAKE